MEEYTKLVTLVETHGLRGILISSSLFVIYTLIKSDWFSNRLGKLSDWFIEKFISNKVKEVDSLVRKINISDISNHDIFNYIDFWTYSKVPTFQFSTEYRTAVFRKYLTIYQKKYRKIYIRKDI